MPRLASTVLAVIALGLAAIGGAGFPAVASAGPLAAVGDDEEPAAPRRHKAEPRRPGAEPLPGQGERHPGRRRPVPPRGSDDEGPVGCPDRGQKLELLV